MTCCLNSCCGPGSYCCTNANPHLHLGDRVIFDWDEACPRCQQDAHRCHGCGASAGHSGEVRSGHDPYCVALEPSALDH